MQINPADYDCVKSFQLSPKLWKFLSAKIARSERDVEELLSYIIQKVFKYSNVNMTYNGYRNTDKHLDS